MAKQTSDFKPTGFRIEAVEFANADGTSTKTISAADADDSVVVQFSISSLSSSDESLRLYLNDGSSDFFLCDVAVPAGAGTGAVDAVDVLTLPMIYNASLPLESGWTIKAAANSAVSVTGDVTVTIILNDY